MNGQAKRASAEDIYIAHEGRMMLARLLIYPTGDLAGNPSFDAEERYRRADLHELVEKLDRTDLRAVHELVRTLVLVPRDPGIFDYIEQMDVRRCKMWGIPIQETEVSE